MNTPFESHTHDAIVHGHEHIHVTHHVRGGEGETEHLVSKHTHEHNHPALQHAHEAHEDFDREHAHEAHTHDHEHPTRSVG